MDDVILNYIALNYHNGKKLIIEFTVQQKAGFLGGNDVFTNDGAGIYENAESKDPLMEFNKPTVNVPIKDIAVTAEDKNVYLLGGVTLDDLKNGATVTVGAKADGTGGITALSRGRRRTSQSRRRSRMRTAMKSPPAISLLW